MLPTVTPPQAALLVLAGGIVAVALQIWTSAPQEWLRTLYLAPMFYGVIAPRRREAKSP